MIDDAKVLTTAEVEALPTIVSTPFQGCVYVTRSELLATTRALETADRLERERNEARARVSELVAALAELTVRLHQERDAARAALAKAKGAANGSR